MKGSIGVSSTRCCKHPVTLNAVPQPTGQPRSRNLLQPLAARDTQISMMSFLPCSSLLKSESRWSMSPSMTRVWHVPHVPSSHEEKTGKPASSATERIERSAGILSVTSELPCV